MPQNHRLAIYITASTVRETPQQHPHPLWQNGMRGVLYQESKHVHISFPLDTQVRSYNITITILYTASKPARVMSRVAGSYVCIYSTYYTCNSRLVKTAVLFVLNICSIFNS